MTPDPVPPGYLRALIKSAGITQAQAAALIRVPPSTLRRWLTDGSSKRAASWQIAELLRIKLKNSRAQVGLRPIESKQS